jgi:hypothetical protein
VLGEDGLADPARVSRILVEARARISTLQRDELLTQSKIFKKETSPPAKEADQHSEAQSYETKHGQDL